MAAAPAGNFPSPRGRGKEWKAAIVNRLLLGIDVGTTGVRAALLDAEGTLVAVADAPVADPSHTAAGGRVEADPEGWWRATCAVLAQLRARAPLQRVEAVGVVGQAPTAVLVDADLRALRPAITWLDVRAGEEAARLSDALGERFEALGGNRAHAYYLGPKLAWLRAHEPDVLDRAALVLQSHAFVAARLTGETACDPSTAMLCAPLLDARAMAWSPEAASAVGVALGKLPRIAASHAVLGAVTADAAVTTGLRAGTPVVSGGGDFAASALGAGVVEEGEACLMLGTSGNLMVPSVEPRFDARLVNSHHVGSDMWLSLGATLCGAALEWFRRAFAPGVPFESLEREAASAPVDGSGPIVVPYLQGERTPVWDDRLRGVFFGLDLTHGRGALYRALVDGIALGFRDSLAVIEERGGRIAEVTAEGGAGRSPLLRQTLSDALGVPLTWVGEGAGTVTGAAALAGIGCGALSGVASAREWGRSKRASKGTKGECSEHHEPDPAERVRLEGIFSRRRAAYDCVATLSHELPSRLRQRVLR